MAPSSSYCEQLGRFATAEDVLFEMLDRGDDVAETGPAFYDRLLAKTETELQDGDLPRNEVEDGRQLLLARLRDRAK